MARGYAHLRDDSEQQVEYEPSTKDVEVTTTELEENIDLFRAIRKWPKVALWSIALSSTILLGGFDSVLVSNVASMPVFQYVPQGPSKSANAIADKSSESPSKPDS